MDTMQNNKAEDFQSGARVRYVPIHAHGDREHQDVEFGTVSTNNGILVFVRFDKQVAKLGWEGATSQSCYPQDLELL